MCNLDASVTLAYYIRSIEDAPDIRCLDQHYCQARDYISAIQETDALPTAQIQSLNAVFAYLYRQGLIRLRAHRDRLDQIER